ncbi:glycerol-3-phosphate 1-O-acyltransferase PlsY [Opitutaceae bacterium]
MSIAAVEGSIPSGLAAAAIGIWALGAAVIGYFLGSLPFGYWVARSHGVNIFEVGSRNPGATNVRRVLGSKAGNQVFALDALKGAVSAGWPLLPVIMMAEPARIPMAVAGLIGALIGHSFSCFTRFKGGKGVATAAGGFLVVAPVVVLTGAAVWAVTFFSTRYVSLASMLAGAILPIAAWFTGQPAVVLVLTLLVALFVIVRHRSNISRLLAGTEPKAGGAKKA